MLAHLSQVNLIINIKKLYSDAIIPSYSKEGDVGLDLTAIDVRHDEDNNYIEYKTGLVLELPDGYEAQIRPRSSISNKNLILINSPATIDPNYRGELLIRFKLMPKNGLVMPEPSIYEIGDRIAQLVIMPVPKITFNVVEKLTDTNRGTGGFGSSGN